MTSLPQHRALHLHLHLHLIRILYLRLVENQVSAAATAPAR